MKRFTPDSDEIKQLAELLSRRSASVQTAAAKRMSDHRGAAAAAVVDKLRVGNLSAQ
ncbi:hypothetical protein NZK35_18445 [Stieleria sp. ICT_E10.1]|uniref:hypothetical protein n=1 Tax=Stieleria sedimenti TaxID=2976331 RepID=UPI00217F838A|nr:hypothetical protein [Stieleria sedimenti]MCS7468637.1 hypothetical protein [Stieleria sedimenti]